MISESGWLTEPDVGAQRPSRFENPGRILRFVAQLAILLCVVETAHAQYGFEAWNDPIPVAARKR